MRKELAGMVIALLIMVLPVSGSIADEDADFLNALTNVINAISALEETEGCDKREQPLKQAAKETSKEASEAISEKKNWSSGKMVEVEIAGKKVKVHESLKEAMDQYEKLFDQYIELLEENNMSMVAYANALTKYAEAMEAIEDIDEDELTDGDYAYYIEVTMRVSQKLLLAEP